MKININGKQYKFNKGLLLNNLSKLAIGMMLLALYGYIFVNMTIAVIEKYN